MALRESPDWESIGPVTMRDGRVCRITSLVGEGGTPGTHFTGIHAMSRESLGRIPGGFQCVVQTAYTELVAEGLVAGSIHSGTWVDVGTPAAYLDANLGVLDGKIPVSISPWSHGQRGEGSSRI